MAVDVGEVQGGGISRKQVLIGAAVLGGGVGLVILLARMRANASGHPTENQAQTSAPQAGALDVAYQNLATQLLGLRGDLSVANADLGQGQADLVSAFGNEAAARAASDDTLVGMLTGWFSGVNTHIDQSAGNVINAVNSSGTNVIGAINSSGENIIAGQNSSASNVISAVNSSGSNVLQGINSSATHVIEAVHQGPQGAGGATLHDAILAAFDGGVGDAAEGMRRMSAGPVRVVSMDRRN
jgi:hypothetical protein